MAIKGKKKTRITELVISKESRELAIDAISLVSEPAIEVDFIYFGKEKNNLTFSAIDEEKRELISPALIPNKQIFRYDPNTDQEYYVYFSKKTVKQASEMYLRYNNHHKATYQHKDRISGILTTESWIKDGKQDKSHNYGFDLPDGTWFVKMKIDNDEIWNKIKTKELKGVSIEGYFVDKLETMSKPSYTDEEVLTALSGIMGIELGSVSDVKEARSKMDYEADKLDTMLKSVKLDLAGEKANKKELDKFQQKVDDFNKIKDEYETTKVLSDRLSSEISTSMGEINSAISKLEAAIDNYKREAKGLRNAVKDLGIDEPNESARMESISKMFEGIVKDARKILNTNRKK